MIYNIEDIEDLKNFLKEYFKNTDVKVYLFGSRAKGKNRKYSDIDLAIESKNDIKDKIAELKRIIEESNLIYKVDIVGLSKADFLKNEEMVLWL